MVSQALALLLIMDVSVGGKIRLFSSIFLSSPEFIQAKAGQFLTTRGDLKLKIDGSVSENISFYSRTDFMFFDRSLVFRPDDTEGVGWRNIIPIEIVPYEAFITISDVFLDGIDLTAGKKRTKWGLADLSPIDIANPYDLANFYLFDPDYFGERIPTTTLQLDINLPSLEDIITDTRIESLYLFSFKPASFPSGVWASRRPEASSLFENRIRQISPLVTDRLFLFALTEVIIAFGYLDPTTYPRTIQYENFSADFTLEGLPEYLLKNAPFGFRLASTILKTDISLMFLRTYFDLPIPSEINNRLEYKNVITPAGGLTTVSGKTETRFFYPKLTLLGLGIARDISGVGIRLEGGYFIPEKRKVFIRTKTKTYVDIVTLTTTTQEFEQEEVREAKLFDNYFKFSVGVDYTFDLLDGFYVNLQYVRGFPDEINYTKEAQELLGITKRGFIVPLQDYFVLRLELPLFREKVKISPTAIVNISDFSEGFWAVATIPIIYLYPWDSSEIQLGGFYSFGEENSKFGIFKNYNIFYAMFSAKF